jgi:hypothetical protein
VHACWIVACTSSLLRTRLESTLNCRHMHAFNTKSSHELPSMVGN